MLVVPYQSSSQSEKVVDSIVLYVLLAIHGGTKSH